MGNLKQEDFLSKYIPWLADGYSKTSCALLVAQILKNNQLSIPVGKYWSIEESDMVRDKVFETVVDAVDSCVKQIELCETPEEIANKAMELFNQAWQHS